MISPEVLRRFQFFSGLEDHQLKALAMIAEERAVEANATLFEEGSPAKKLYLLCNGSVDLYIKSEEENVPASRRDFAVGEINPGEVFGFSTLLEPQRGRVTARCAGRGDLIEFDGAAVNALMQVDKGLAYLFMFHTANTLMERLISTRVQLAAAWA